jgi:hypothetical protein
VLLRDELRQEVVVRDEPGAGGLAREQILTVDGPDYAALKRLLETNDRVSLG